MEEERRRRGRPRKEEETGLQISSRNISIPSRKPRRIVPVPYVPKSAAGRPYNLRNNYVEEEPVGYNLRKRSRHRYEFPEYYSEEEYYYPRKRKYVLPPRRRQRLEEMYHMALRASLEPMTESDDDSESSFENQFISKTYKNDVFYPEPKIQNSTKVNQELPPNSRSRRKAEQEQVRRQKISEYMGVLAKCCGITETASHCSIMEKTIQMIQNLQETIDDLHKFAVDASNTHGIDLKKSLDQIKKRKNNHRPTTPIQKQDPKPRRSPRKNANDQMTLQEIEKMFQEPIKDWLPFNEI